MSTVTIYGVGDDLIEVEGVDSRCDEYNGDDEHFIVVGNDGQVRLRVWYTRRGVWAIAASPVDDGVTFMLPVKIDQTENGYSARAVVNDVRFVIREKTESDG